MALTPALQRCKALTGLSSYKVGEGHGPLVHGIIIALLGFILLGQIVLSIGCERSGQSGEASATGKTPGAGSAETTGNRFDPDNERDSLTYHDLLELMGTFSKPRKDYKIGVLVRFLGNPYHQLLTEGMYSKGRELGLFIDFQAGATESDQAGQFSALETMIDRRYDAILISPQTDGNLEAAVAKAKRHGVLIVDVDAAVLPDVRYYVGPNQYENGARAAWYLMSKVSGGKVAVLRGSEEDYGVNRRVRGFVDTLARGSFELVADIECVRDLQTALRNAAEIMEKHPDIVCIFCTSDIMALGAVHAVKFADRSDQVIVIGRGGIPAAFDSIRSGVLSGTVDTFPFETGKIAVDVAVRILEGQKIPRVVITTQELVTRDNIAR